MSESQLGPTVNGYSTCRQTWRLADRRVVLTWPREPDALLDLPSTQERFARNEYMPYWAQPWPASVLLAEYLLREVPGCGREAIELGCGVGLVSIAAALAGWRVTASDYDEDAVAFTAFNARENQVDFVETCIIDFIESRPRRRYDAVLAADLLYERRLSAPLVEWMAEALTPGGIALVSDPNRSAAEQFETCLLERGLRADAIQVETIAPAGLLTRGRIWRISFQD